MAKKQDSIEENSTIFMEWPNIEIDGDNMVFKSKITKVTVINPKHKEGKIISPAL